MCLFALPQLTPRVNKCLHSSGNNGHKQTAIIDIDRGCVSCVRASPIKLTSEGDGALEKKKLYLHYETATGLPVFFFIFAEVRKLFVSLKAWRHKQKTRLCKEMCRLEVKRLAVRRKCQATTPRHHNSTLSVS